MRIILSFSHEERAPLCASFSPKPGYGRGTHPVHPGYGRGTPLYTPGYGRYTLLYTRGMGGTPCYIPVGMRGIPWCIPVGMRGIPWCIPGWCIPGYMPPYYPGGVYWAICLPTAPSWVHLLHTLSGMVNVPVDVLSAVLAPWAQ